MTADTFHAGRIPLTVIGGFLGSGKTTLLNRMLQASDGRRLAVLGPLENADLVGTDDFYRNDHRLIFAAISRLIDASKAADAVTVFEAWRQNGFTGSGG